MVAHDCAYFWRRAGRRENAGEEPGQHDSVWPCTAMSSRSVELPEEFRSAFASRLDSSMADKAVARLEEGIYKFGNGRDRM